MAATIESELVKLTKAHRGLLRPADVVDAARDPENPLHDSFQWDDTKAAEEYRLWQARELIQIHVTIIGNDTEPVRAYVSLLGDRHASGGYRAIVDVLNDDDLYARLLAQSLDEYRRLGKKYKQLKELQPVRDAVKAASAKAKKKARKRARVA